ncbi:MAG: hypothetical protein GY834_10640 [Bacteroidetes bacterium]|nr:hypothetical protein [Bacteroidota bacterium]
MNKLIKIIHQLRSVKGSKKKIEVLKQHSDNALWKKFLIYTLDTRATYGVSAPLNNVFGEKTIDETMFISLNPLIKREATGNDAKKLAKYLSETYGEIPRLILGRSLKAGVSVKIINNAYPGLIFSFESMKGKDVPIQEYPVISSIKYDGVKVFAIVKDSIVRLLTSSGAEFILKSLIDGLKRIKDGVYEGELTHKEGKQEHRTTISGKLNSLLAGTLDNIDEYNFRIYDYIPLNEWETKESVLTYSERHKILEHQSFECEYISLVPQIQHHNLKEVTEFYESLVKIGYEGSIHRYEQDLYVWKRVDRLIKKKAIKECVLTCIDTVPHSNPSKGITGALICEGHIKDKEYGDIFIQVNAGSGLSKYDIQCSKERYLNKEVEILYNSITKTDNGYSLFLPRLKRILGDN